jgi:hypothetical protein
MIEVGIADWKAKAVLRAIEEPASSGLVGDGPSSLSLYLSCTVAPLA